MSLPRKRPAYFFITATSIEQARSIAREFMRRHREFELCRVNAMRMIRYMKANNLGASLEGLDAAFSALRAEGKIVFKKTIPKVGM